MNTLLTTHYDCFVTMISVATTLGNLSCNEYNVDASALLDFIGEAFGLDKAHTEQAKELILEEMVAVSTSDDVYAFSSSLQYNSEPTFEETLLQLKVNAFHELSNEDRGYKGNVNNYFNYETYRPYFAPTRYQEIATMASEGNLQANRCCALMQALGIGTEKDENVAKIRLRQCVIWGDKASCKLLSYLYIKDKDEENAKLYGDLFTLHTYISQGRSLIPEEDKTPYSEKAKQLFAIVSAIRQDIIRAFDVKAIDYAFVELMCLPKVDFYAKLRYINEYRQEQWKNALYSPVDPSRHLGFDLGGKKK